jgi:2-dehydropantoate 2-reductase
VHYVVVGAGAIGGVVGAALHDAGVSVSLVARGAHLDVLRRRGLTAELPDRVVTVPPVRVLAMDDVVPAPDAVVLLATKTQHVDESARGVRDRVGPSVPVLCLQNGVAGERMAARFFEHVYGVSVMSPNEFLTPGVVRAYSTPVLGVLDLGAVCGGDATLAGAVRDDLRRAGFASDVVDDVMAVKHGKLLRNLGNAVEAVCGPGTRGGDVDRAARQEALACYAAAGVVHRADASRGALVTPVDRPDRARVGGSTLQSLVRGAGSTETDHLNGEICLLGRLNGVPTPVNAALQVAVARILAGEAGTGDLTEADLLAAAGTS